MAHILRSDPTSPKLTFCEESSLELAGKCVKTLDPKSCRDVWVSL